jgi:hypothetical protein
MTAAAERFRFIGHALAGTGPFRPVVVETGTAGQVTVSGDSAIIRYPRESLPKYARRNQVAFYASPLARACARFVGYLFTRDPVREVPHDLYAKMVDDIDGRGNALDVWWGTFAVELKARGSMLLLVDMPEAVPETMAAQIAQRRVPVWTQVAPESLTDYALGEDGKFEFAEFSGTWTQGGEQVACTWHFDRQGWSATDKDRKTLGQGVHGLGECPLLICTESGDFPSFGPFAAIADLARRLFNLDSELDEILRGQTFSLLTMEVSKDSTDEQKLAAAKVAGETIGTANLLVHTGGTPSFIAPASGPADVYLRRIEDIRAQIDEIALKPRESGQRESGDAMRMRFAAINGELARFAGRLEDLERRAWALSQRWLQMPSIVPQVSWSRDYNVADVAAELQLLRDMRDAGMPREVLVEQQRRIVAVQFAGLSPDDKQRMVDAIDTQLHAEDHPGAAGGNVVSLPDRNAGMREAIVRTLNAGAGNG